MGSYVLGGALQGLGSGINSAVSLYTKQKQLDVENALAKIKAEAEKNASDLDLYNKGGRLGTAPIVPGSVMNGQTLGVGNVQPPSPGTGALGKSTDLTHGTSFAAPTPSLGEQAAAIPQNPYQQVTPGMYVDTTKTPYAQNMALKDLLYGHQDYLQGVKGNQRMDQIGAQGENQATTANIRGGYQVQTTGMRNDQSNTNNLRTTSTSAANNVRTNAQSNTNNVRTTDQSNTNNLRTNDPANHPGRGAGGAAGGNQDLEGAKALVAQADSSMTAFEDKVKSGNATLDASSMAMAREVLHGSPIKATAAEAILNHTNPELASYVRSAKQFATGQRMIMPRGGSNILAQAEALLSGAGANATPEQIDAARGYRHASMSGKLHGGAPDASSTQSPSGKPSLQDRVQQLKASGLSKDAARQQLLKEGYSF